MQQMTETTEYTKALARAERDGVRVIDRTYDGAAYRVLGSMGKGGRKIYMVNAETLARDCDSRIFCKHQAICLHHIRQQRAAQATREAASLVQDAARNAAIMATTGNNGARLFR